MLAHKYYKGCDSFISTSINYIQFADTHSHKRASYKDETICKLI